MSNFVEAFPYYGTQEEKDLWVQRFVNQYNQQVAAGTGSSTAAEPGDIDIDDSNQVVDTRGDTPRRIGWARRYLHYRITSDSAGQTTVDPDTYTGTLHVFIFNSESSTTPSGTANFILSNTFTNWVAADRLYQILYGFNNVRFERSTTELTGQTEINTPTGNIDLETGITNGVDGDNGSSTFIVYATDTAGTDQSFTQGTRNFIRFISAVSQPTLPVTGTFTQITGNTGIAGAQGSASRLDIAYFTNAAGSGGVYPTGTVSGGNYTAATRGTRNFQGTNVVTWVTGSEPAVSTTASDYEITQITGDDGIQGAQGSFDIDVYHVAAASVTPGTPTGGVISTAGVVTTAPTGNPSSQTWVTSIPSVTGTNVLWQARFRFDPATPGATIMWSAPFQSGSMGPAGATGDPGLSNRLDIAYGDTDDGTGNTQFPTGTRGGTYTPATPVGTNLYIGTNIVTWTSTEPAVSTTHADYEWTRLTGEQGDRGEQGEQGEQGEAGQDAFGPSLPYSLATSGSSPSSGGARYTSLTNELSIHNEDTAGTDRRGYLNTIGVADTVRIAIDATNFIIATVDSIDRTSTVRTVFTITGTTTTGTVNAANVEIAFTTAEAGIDGDDGAQGARGVHGVPGYSTAFSFDNRTGADPADGSNDFRLLTGGPTTFTDIPSANPMWTGLTRVVLDASEELETLERQLVDDVDALVVFYDDNNWAHLRISSTTQVGSRVFVNGELILFEGNPSSIDDDVPVTMGFSRSLRGDTGLAGNPVPSVRYSLGSTSALVFNENADGTFSPASSLVTFIAEQDGALLSRESWRVTPSRSNDVYSIAAIEENQTNDLAKTNISVIRRGSGDDTTVEATYTHPTTMQTAGISAGFNINRLAPRSEVVTVYLTDPQSDRPTAPSFTRFNFTTGLVTAGLTTGWQNGPVALTITNTSDLYWSQSFQVTENVFNGATQTIRAIEIPVSSVNFGNNIQSDNFVSGSDGWQIQRDTGNAEFNNVTVRGDIISSNYSAGVYNFNTSSRISFGNRDTVGAVSNGTWDLRNGTNIAISTTVSYSSWADWENNILYLDAPTGMNDVIRNIVQGQIIRISISTAQADFIVGEDAIVSLSDTLLSLNMGAPVNTVGTPPASGRLVLTISQLDFSNAEGHIIRQNGTAEFNNVNVRGESVVNTATIGGEAAIVLATISNASFQDSSDTTNVSWTGNVFTGRANADGLLTVDFDSLQFNTSLGTSLVSSQLDNTTFDFTVTILDGTTTVITEILPPQLITGISVVSGTAVLPRSSFTNTIFNRILQVSEGDTVSITLTITRPTGQSWTFATGNTGGLSYVDRSFISENKPEDTSAFITTDNLTRNAAIIEGGFGLKLRRLPIFIGSETSLINLSDSFSGRDGAVLVIKCEWNDSSLTNTSDYAVVRVNVPTSFERELDTSLSTGYFYNIPQTIYTRNGNLAGVISLSAFNVPTVTGITSLTINSIVSHSNISNFRVTQIAYEYTA